jgi:hypothetical protein
MALLSPVTAQLPADVQFRRIIAFLRLHLVDVPFTKAVSVISKWGAGAGDLLKAMRPA